MIHSSSDYKRRATPTDKIKSADSIMLNIYLNGFIPSPHDSRKTMCLICMNIFSDDSMTPCKLKIHPEAITHKKRKPTIV